MESIYWVISKDCSQTCGHCYNFSAPGGPGLSLDELLTVVDRLPARHEYRSDDGEAKAGRIILSGGEVLIDRVREPLLYPCLEALWKKYEGRARLWIQTNGDVFDEKILRELESLNVSRIDVSGIDGFHENVEGKKERIEALFRKNGWKPAGAALETAGDRAYCFWGATPDMWIGKIWPTGRALAKGISKAGPEDNFCGDWSGGLGFLNGDAPGSEVNIQLDRVYPCCRQTCKPIGSLLEESLEAILDRRRGDPVFEAINRGKPEEMGVAGGLSVEKALARIAELGNGCLFCDEFLRSLPVQNF